MKFDSHIFDRIRVKPAEDRRARTESPACEWPGCRNPGTHRAPKGRLREGEKWRFCLDHVREYNQSYDFFAGMSEDAVLKYQKDAITGHRPTWKIGTGARGANYEPGHFYVGPDGAVDPFGFFHEFGGHPRKPEAERAQREARSIRNAERKALDVLGLEAGATRTDIKARFKELVKRHHPDANGGDRSTEDRLVEIIQSYNYLKTAGLC
jgi:curved DNA-binding protein CbpA